MEVLRGRGNAGADGGGGGGLTMEFSIQNMFDESHSSSLVRLRDLIELYTFRTLHFYPIFEDEKSNESEGKMVKRKII